MISNIHIPYKLSYCFVSEKVAQDEYTEFYAMHGDVNSSSRIAYFRRTNYRDVKIVHLGNPAFISDYSSPYDFIEPVCIDIYYVHISERKGAFKILIN
jgi:hypothetical protein